MIERQTDQTNPPYITGINILELKIDVLEMKQFISLFVVHLLGLRSRDNWFMPHQGHCVVSFRKTLYPDCLELVSTQETVLQ